MALRPAAATVATSTDAAATEVTSLLWCLGAGASVSCCITTVTFAISACGGDLQVGARGIRSPVVLYKLLAAGWLVSTGMTVIFFFIFRRWYLRKSLDILQGGGGLMQQTGTSNSWTEDMVGTCICVSAYLRKGKFQRRQQNHKKIKEESKDIGQKECSYRF